MADPSYNLGKVFVSYSHRDKQWLDRLRVHLKPLERESVFDVWDDTRIAAGQTWRTEIQKAVEAASVAVLLVSKDFLASDFIAENELPPLLQAAKSQGITILSVILSPCRFEQTKSLFELQAVNSPRRTLSEMPEAEQDRVFVNLSDQIHAALIRPVTGLRDKLQQKFREIDHEFEQKYREVESDPRLENHDKEFFLGVYKSSELNRKREIVMAELIELDKKQLDKTVKRDRKGVKASASDEACYDRQSEFLKDEMQQLELAEMTAKARAKLQHESWMENARTAWSKLPK